MNFKEIINSIPEVYSKLFYDSYTEGDMKECSKCHLRYPKHVLFFKPHNATKDGFHYCRECVNQFFTKIVRNDTANVFRGLHNIFANQLSSINKKMCYGCLILFENNQEYFANGAYCRICTDIPRKESLYGENLHLAQENKKKCKYCLEIKELSEFPTYGVKKTKIMGYCYNCEDFGKEEKSSYDRTYTQNNSDVKKAYYQQWKISGGELKRRHSEDKRRALIKSLPLNFTEIDWVNCLEHFDYSCAYCGESQEKNLEIYGAVLSKEHVIPIKDNGSFEAKNIVPSCVSCNSRKGTRNLDSFYRIDEMFTAERFMKVKQFIS
ncbi:HNH endonuclease [Paenibacillus sp. QZ-Y1]|uniref:HNH endonuclease n=1 Tax=Paenibacillus sp. QZ-Y1 TaxID=3414511 RepID=UPI003F7994C2